MGHPVPNFKSHNIIMSARVYFKKRVKYCKDVSIIKVNSGDRTRIVSVCICNSQYLLFYNRMQSKHKQTQCEHSRRNPKITAFSVGITILNQRIICKDDIEFVTEFPCSLGHPVCSSHLSYKIWKVWKLLVPPLTGLGVALSPLPPPPLLYTPLNPTPNSFRQQCPFFP